MPKRITRRQLENRRKKRLAELEEQSLILIKQHKIITFTDLASRLHLSRQALYERGLDRLDTIKKAIEDQKEEIKAFLRKKWMTKEYSSPATDVVLYKLCGSSEERDALRQGAQQKKEEVGEKGASDTKFIFK